MSVQTKKDPVLVCTCVTHAVEGGTGRDFSIRTSDFRCVFHHTSAAYSFFQLSLTPILAIGRVVKHISCPVSACSWCWLSTFAVSVLVRKPSPPATTWHAKPWQQGTLEVTTEHQSHIGENSFRLHTWEVAGSNFGTDTDFYSSSRGLPEPRILNAGMAYLK